MKRFALILVFCLGVFGLSRLYAQQEMPQYVLHAAQTLNAQYGANIDVNNVIWNYVDYNIDLAGASADCERLTTAAPPLNNTRVYLVEFQPVRNGLWGEEIWEAMVYGDLSFVALCEAPLPEATPVTPGAVLPTVTPSSCGTMPSRLVIGQEGRVAAGDSPNNLRAEPFVSGAYLGEIPPLGIFIVLDGPRCSADGAWWYVNYNGTAGWTLEGQNGTYYLEPLSLVGAQPTQAPTLAPLTAPATPVVCNPTLPSRMIIGAIGRVTPGIPNNVRAQAGSSGQYLGEIPAEGVFRVLAGPSCASGIAWWQVDYNGLVGWTAEGADGDYWIEPQFAAIPPLSVSNITSIRQYVSTSQADAHVLQFSPNNTLFAADQTSIMQYTHNDAFSDSPASSTWSAHRIGAYNFPVLNFQVVGNGVQWVALQAPDAVSLHYSEDPVYVLFVAEGSGLAERYTVPLIASKAVFSPDAHYLLLVDSSQQIHIFDTSVGQETAIIPSVNRNVEDIRFSPDGRFVAAQFSDGIIRWETGSWTMLANTFFDQGSVSAQTLSMNNSQLSFVINGPDGSFVHIEDLYGSQPSVVPYVRVSSSAPIIDTVLSPDGKLVIIATENGLEFGDVSTIPPYETLRATALPITINGTIRQLLMSPDGRFLAIATDTDVQLWAVNVP